VAGLHGPAEEMGSRANAFSWIDQNRRLSEDYEKLPATSEAFVYVAMSRLMVKRLARS
jgi:transposase